MPVLKSVAGRPEWNRKLPALTAGEQCSLGVGTSAGWITCLRTVPSGTMPISCTSTSAPGPSGCGPTSMVVRAGASFGQNSRHTRSTAAPLMCTADVDTTAYSAAAEVAPTPDRTCKPVVIGAAPTAEHGRGVVTAATYEARRYGTRTATPISRACRLAEAARRRGD